MIAVFKPHDDRIYLVPHTGENYMLLVRHLREYGKREGTSATDAVEYLLQSCDFVTDVPVTCHVAFLFRPEW